MQFTNKPIRNLDGSVPASYYDEDYWERGAESGKGSYNTNVHPLETCKYWAQDTWNRWGPFKEYLELGCGRGWAIYGFLHLPELGVQPMGVDFSHYAITTAHEEVRSYLVEADISDLSFIQGQSKDLIFSNDVLEHLTEDQIDSCLEGCRRIARKRVVHLISIGDGKDLPIGEAPSDQDQSHTTLKSLRWWLNRFNQHFPVPMGSAERFWLLDWMSRGRTIEIDLRSQEL